MVRAVFLSYFFFFDLQLTRELHLMSIHLYREGEFSYLDVLDVQRSLFDAKDTYINSLVSYHMALTALERLLGENLTSLETLQTSHKE
jgi:outer membrane protein TolC